jgi:hypothetical protein
MTDKIATPQRPKVLRPADDAPRSCALAALDEAFARSPVSPRLGRNGNGDIVCVRKVAPANDPPKHHTS